MLLFNAIKLSQIDSLSLYLLKITKIIIFFKLIFKNILH